MLAKKHIKNNFKRLKFRLLYREKFCANLVLVGTFCIGRYRTRVFTKVLFYFRRNRNSDEIVGQFRRNFDVSFSRNSDFDFDVEIGISILVSISISEFRFRFRFRYQKFATKTEMYTFPQMFVSNMDIKDCFLYSAQ
jgi:hypothetical protein